MAVNDLTESNTYIKDQGFSVHEEQLHRCVLFQEGELVDIKPVKKRCRHTMSSSKELFWSTATCWSPRVIEAMMTNFKVKHSNMSNQKYFNWQEKKTHRTRKLSSKDPEVLEKLWSRTLRSSWSQLFWPLSKNKLNCWHSPTILYFHGSKSSKQFNIMKCDETNTHTLG